MGKLILLNEVIKKINDENETMFIGNFSFLEWIKQNEETFKIFLIEKYGDLVSNYYDNNTVSDIQVSILSFNTVNNTFFLELYDLFNDEELYGRYDEIIEKANEYGVDVTSINYGGEVKNFVYGANRVVTGTSGSMATTNYKQGLNSNTFKPNEKNENTYNDYEVESNSDTYTNSETKNSRKDVTQRNGREDEETTKIIKKDFSGLVQSDIDMWKKMFNSVYIEKLLGYITIGMFS